MPKRTTASALAFPIIAAIVMVVAAFMGATLLSRHVANATRDDAAGIALIGAPSIEHLAAIRTGVLDLQVTLVSLLSEEQGRMKLLEKTEDLLTDIDEDKRAYEALPMFAGERELWATARRELVRHRRIVSNIFDAVKRGDLEAARTSITTELLPQTEQTGLALFSAIHLNSTNVKILAESIESRRELANRLAYLLTGLATLLAIVVAILIYRAIGRNAELKERHEQVLMERADELEMFALRVAHDIRNPLAAASVALQYAQRSADNREQLERAVARSLSSVRRAAEVVMGLYQFAESGARATPGESSSAADVVHEVVQELLPTAHKARLEIVASQIPPVRVACNSGVLGSLLSNFLGNAIKYSSSESDGSIAVRVAKHGARARFEVEDHGPGLPPRLESSVFNPYVRGDMHHQPGLGLGLATVKRLSERHGGACGVRSSPGRGCVFWFELPLAQALESFDRPDALKEESPSSFRV